LFFIIINNDLPRSSECYLAYRAKDSPFPDPPSRQSIEYFHEAHGGFAIWLDPFGIFDPQVVVNLLPEFGIGVDLVRHGNWLGERFKCVAARRPAWGSCPSVGIPKSGMHAHAVCTTPSQMECSVALALQQHG